MACSCRTSALRIFVRSLTEVYTPPNNTFARTAWRDPRPQVSTHTTRVGVSCRRLHASARACSSTQDGAVDPAPSEATEQQHAPREEQKSAQQVEDDRLFEITRRSKNAIKKARKYPNASNAPVATGTENREAQEIHEVHKADEAQETQEVQVQEKKFVGVKRIIVDETRGSKNSTRGAYFEGRRRKEDRPQQFDRGSLPEEKKRDTRPMWAIQKEALKAKFPEGWMPRKRLSPDALTGIRALHQQFPEIYTTAALSEKFEVSPEAIRRILRAKWEAADEEDEDRQRRWFNRGLSVWERYAELGKVPPKKWQDAGVQARPWNGRRWEEGEGDEGDEEHGDEYGDERGEDHDAKEERLRRLRTQVKLAKSLM